MNPILVALFALIASSVRRRLALQAENLALRHQLTVLQARAPRHLRLQPGDRFLRVLLSDVWSGWRSCLQIVQPDTESSTTTASADSEFPPQFDRALDGGLHSSHLHRNTPKLTPDNNYGRFLGPGNSFSDAPSYPPLILASDRELGSTAYAYSSGFYHGKRVA
jgi:hypothetical protein